LKLFRINSIGTALRALTGWPLFLIGLYFAAALAGSFIPANSDWREPDRGIPIFVETNGVHVSLIVPMSAAGEDLSDLIRPEHLANTDLYGTHAMVGWGHKRVYRNAQSWSDVQSADIACIASAFWSASPGGLVDHRLMPRPCAFLSFLRPGHYSAQHATTRSVLA
jgi:hypothetical protein